MPLLRPRRAPSLPAWSSCSGSRSSRLFSPVKGQRAGRITQVGDETAVYDHRLAARSTGSLPPRSQLLVVDSLPRRISMLATVLTSSARFPLIVLFNVLVLGPIALLLRTTPIAPSDRR